MQITQTALSHILLLSSTPTPDKNVVDRTCETFVQTIFCIPKEIQAHPLRAPPGFIACTLVLELPPYLYMDLGMSKELLTFRVPYFFDPL